MHAPLLGKVLYCRRRLLAILIVSSFFEFEVSLSRSYSLSLSFSRFPFHLQFCSEICFRLHQEVCNTFLLLPSNFHGLYLLSPTAFCHKSIQLFLFRSQEIHIKYIKCVYFYLICNLSIFLLIQYIWLI